MYQNNIQRTSNVDYPAIKQPKILWKTNIGIQGYLNNSIVVKNRIYVGSSGLEHNESDRKDGIYCLNAANGQILWHYKTSIDACGVAYSDGKVISTGDDGYLRGLDAVTGKEIWNVKRAGNLYAQPLIISEKAFIGDDSGTIFAVDIKTGKVLWENKVATDNIRGGLASDGKKIFAAFVDGTIAALQKEGKTIWKSECQRTVYDSDDKVNAEIYAAPTVADNKLIIPFARKTYYDYPALHAYDKNTGELIWEATDELKEISHGNIRSSVAVWNDFLLYGNPYSNKLIAIDVKNGKPAWATSMGIETWPHWPSPAIAQNTLYLGRNDGGFYAVDLKTQKLVWEIYLGKSSHAGDMKNVAEEDRGGWKPSFGESIYATPSISKAGTIYIGSGEGWMYAIGE
jgi:outer membrane protein assembly factor BamB